MSNHFQKNIPLTGGALNESNIIETIAHMRATIGEQRDRNIANILFPRLINRDRYKGHGRPRKTDYYTPAELFPNSGILSL